MTVSPTPQTSYLDNATTALTTVASQITNLYTSAETCTETKEKLQGALRTTVGLYTIYYSPVTAIGAGVASSFNPTLAAKVSGMAENTLTGFWNGMDLKTKTVVVVGGISLSYICPPLVPIIGQVIAAKMGSELAVRNHKKEQVATKLNEIDKNID